MSWNPEEFARELLAVVKSHQETDTDPTEDMASLYGDAANGILDGEIADLPMLLMERRGRTASFRAGIRSRWGHAFDLYELLLDHCWAIGSGTNEHYRPIAVQSQDHRFETLSRLHGKATLTASEILSLLETGHAMGAMARWRTLHEVDVASAFLSQQSDEISYRYLRYEEVQTLKARRAYDRFHERLGYEPTDLEADGDPEALKSELIEEFGKEFLERNGWATPVFGFRPSDAQIEEAAELDHYRPYYYLASDAVHATPKGLMANMQQVGDVPMIMAGPSNAGLADPGHGGALSLTRATITLTHYCGFSLGDGAGDEESASIVLTTHLLLELADRVGQAFLEAHHRLEADEEAINRQAEESTS